MTPEQALKAIEYYKLTLFSPTDNGVVKDSMWYAVSRDKDCYGFGATPIEAVQAAVDYKGNNTCES